MPIIRYTSVCIFIALFSIVLGLRAQGFERNILLPDVTFANEIHHYALPSNALLFGSEQNFSLLDENGQTLFTRKLPDEQKVHGLSASSNGDSLIVHSITLEINGTFAYRYYYNIVGDLLGEVVTQLQPIIADRFAPGGEFGFTRPDGGSIVVYTMLSGYSGGSSPDEANLGLVANISHDGTLESTESFEIPDYFFDLQEVDTLSDGSMAVLLSIDTLTEEGEIDLDVADGALYHFYPGDTLLRVSEFVNDIDGSSFITNTSGTRFAFGRLAFTVGPVDFSIYDLADDSLVDTYEVPTSTQFVASPLNILDAPDGGYYLHEEINFVSMPDEDNFIRVRRLDAAGNPLDVYSGSSAFGDLIGADVFGFKPNGNLYGAMYNPGRNFAQPPGYHYFYFELDEELQSFTNLIRGGIYPETVTGSCTPDPNEAGLANWWVVAEPTTPGLETLYAFTDNAGQFAIDSDSSEYLLRAIPPNSYFSSDCSVNPVTLGPAYDTVDYNFAVEVLFDCPLVSLSLSSTPFEGCEPGFYSIGYLNTGASAEENPVLIVELDSFFTPTSSTPAWTSQDGNTLTFELDPIEVNEMGFVYINGSMDCLTALPGQTHCTEARILPDTFCLPPAPEWDGSSIEVSGSCIDDTVRFQIQNVGLDMQTELSYVVIEDFVIHLGGPFVLPSDGVLDITVPVVEGHAYIMESEQALFHPGSSSPAVGVEGCGDFDPGDFTLGLVAQYPQDEGDPFVAKLCAQSVVDGSNQPQTNADDTKKGQLTVSPTGIGPERLVDTTATIDYTVGFRNLGLAENGLYRVLVEGQLPEALDLATLRPGAASHPYEFSVSSTGEIRFVIQNEDHSPLLIQPATGGWGGFVEFSVDIRSGLPHGSPVCFQPQLTLNARAVELIDEQCLTVRKPQRYGVITERFCVPGLDEPIVTRMIDSFSFFDYDSILLTIVNEAGSFEVNDYRTVAVGDTIAGQVITANAVLEELLQTSDGCDSLVTYYVIATGIYEPARELGLSVFPNPTSSRLYIRIEENGRPELVRNLRLYDLLGRSYALSTNNYLPDAGSTISFDLAHLPPGQYLLTGQDGSRHWFKRVIIR
ncbi:hypothetical protein CEQ90_02390 [Lewinellaceae bacterium SD302]|nr:hypothetical protein CEQ90_02390 [Lewinellaceae bacterium SD302]